MQLNELWMPHAQASSHTHTHTLSLSLSLSHTHTHKQFTSPDAKRWIKILLMT